MAPRNLSKKQAEHAVAGEDFESEQETLDPKAISKDMEKNTHTRKTQKRSQLAAKYQQEVSVLDQRILSVTASATKLLAEIRQDQQRRLHELVRRRSEIEGQIVQQSQVLDKAYDAASREMRAAARGRLEDLEPNNGDEENLGGYAGGTDARQALDKEAVKNAEERARKETKV